ncbi:hypothetical protein C1X30_33970, partial [Pseudomonas sp. FW305-BF6]
MKVHEDQVIGVIIAYHVSELAKLDQEMLEIIRRNTKLDAKVDKEAEEGDYYIDTVSVYPAYQGLGIGTELLNGLLAHAKTIGVE